MERLRLAGIETEVMPLPTRVRDVRRTIRPVGLDLGAVTAGAIRNEAGSTAARARGRPRPHELAQGGALRGPGRPYRAYPWSGTCAIASLPTTSRLPL